MKAERFENGEHFFWFAKQNKVQCPEIGYLANKLSNQYTETTGEKASYITHIISNVYLGWAYNQAVAYFSKNEYWVKYNATVKNRKDKFSVIKFRKELKFLISNDLVQVIKGHKIDGKPHLSMASRMLSTEKLEAEFDIAWESYTELADENIRYKRNKDDRSIPMSEFSQYDDIPEVTEEVQNRSTDLAEYNTYIRNFYCTHTDTNTHFMWDSAKKTTVTETFEGEKRFIPLLSSVYSGGWDKGGRIYSRSVFGMASYQNLSKAQRETIKINGETTAEVDYSCLHLSIMYAKCGKQLTKDAYGWCEDRELAKKITIICLNNSTYSGALSACRKWLRENGHDVHVGSPTLTYVHNMLRYHNDIREQFFTKRFDALKIQNDDSKIMMSVLKACRRRNIPALPVHDSIIVPASKKNAAIRIMKEKYKAYTGFEIKVK